MAVQTVSWNLNKNYFHTSTIVIFVRKLKKLIHCICLNLYLICLIPWFWELGCLSDALLLIKQTENYPFTTLEYVYEQGVLWLKINFHRRLKRSNDNYSNDNRCTDIFLSYIPVQANKSAMRLMTLSLTTWVEQKKLKYSYQINIGMNVLKRMMMRKNVYGNY